MINTHQNTALQRILSGITSHGIFGVETSAFTFISEVLCF